jgi:hypothetical protein
MRDTCQISTYHGQYVDVLLIVNSLRKFARKTWTSSGCQCRRLVKIARLKASIPSNIATCCSAPASFNIGLTGHQPIGILNGRNGTEVKPTSLISSAGFLKSSSDARCILTTPSPIKMTPLSDCTVFWDRTVIATDTREKVTQLGIAARLTMPS